MIWITTLCLLAVALWLFFNALNERRWVDAHSHDETVASDEGLFASLTSMTKTAMPTAEGGTPSNGDSPLERATASLKSGTQKAKTSVSEMYERATQPDGALGENSTAGRLAAKTREKASKLNEKLDASMKSGSNLTTGSSSEGGESFLKKAAATTGSVTRKMANGVKNSADNLSGKTNSAGEESLLSKIAGKVSSGMNAVDQKLDKRSTSSTGDDIAAKVGEKMDQVESKIDGSKS